MIDVPTLIRKVFEVTKEKGIAVTLNKIKRKLAKEFGFVDKFKPVDVLEIANDLQHDITPLLTVSIQRERKRLNIVTDSINGDSLFGGVATALIISSKLAVKNNMDLRIITRTAGVNPGAYVEFI